MSADTIILGADSLCWHARLEYGDLTLDGMLEEAAAAGCSFVQLSMHHARGLGDEELAALAARSRELGLPMLASGDFVGSPRQGDDPGVGAAHIAHWLERARLLGSPSLRVVSGFYRADLAGDPGAIEQERRYVIDVLRVAAADTGGVRVLLENHSDFNAEEFASIVEVVGADHVGVFLDLINPISAFEAPLGVVERLAPLAPAGHVKDYALASDVVEGGYHRRGFRVGWCYPGEGVADIEALVAALERGRPEGPFHLSVEGLDNRKDQADQPERLARSLALLRGVAAGCAS